MSVFKRSTNITGKYKELVIVDNKFCDPDTGEEIDVISQLQNIYGNNVFSLQTSYKADQEIDPDCEE